MYPYPGDHLSLARHFYILILFFMFAQEYIFNKMVFSSVLTNMTTSWQENPCPGRHKMLLFVSPFTVHHFCILSSSYLCPGEESFKEIFKMHLLYDSYVHALA